MAAEFKLISQENMDFDAERAGFEVNPIVRYIPAVEVGVHPNYEEPV